MEELRNNPEKLGEFTVRPVLWSDAESARRIRFEVFVDEQQVPAELELDEIDESAHHVLAEDSAGEACGTGRLFADPQDPSCAHVGRMAVTKRARGQGCGSALLCALVNHARQLGFARVILSAQTHALAFYARHGFEPYGEVYKEAGIPHQKMELKLR